MVTKKHPGADALRARVREVRDDLGVSDRQLSERAGLSEKHVSNFLRGEIADLTVSSAIGIARAAGVRVGWLVDGEGSKKEHAEEGETKKQNEPRAKSA
jgi:transcriptional regulator with XRE-family HTH domain